MRSDYPPDDLDHGFVVAALGVALFVGMALGGIAVLVGQTVVRGAWRW